MHCGAVRVKKLQALGGRVLTFVGRLHHGKPGVPLAEEQAQVNLMAQGQAHVAGGADVLVHADFFMHHTLVAGQRHHRAAQFQGLQQLHPRAAQGRGLQGVVMRASVGGDGLALAHADGGGSVNGALAAVPGGAKPLADVSVVGGRLQQARDGFLQNGAHCRVSGVVCHRALALTGCGGQVMVAAGGTGSEGVGSACGASVRCGVSSTLSHSTRRLAVMA